MEQLLADLDTERAELTQKIEAQRTVVRRLELEVQTLRSTQFLSTQLARRERELAEATAALNTLGDRFTDVSEVHEAGKSQLARLQQGDFGPPRAHIRHAHAPQPPIAVGSR